MSLLKYQDNADVTHGNGRGPVSFNRAHIDGVPFRGSVPLLKEEEYENLAETVYDAHVNLFDLSDPEQKKQLQDVLDRASNGWYQIYAHVPHWTKDDTMKVYLVWTEAHKEVNKQRVPTWSRAGLGVQ